MKETVNSELNLITIIILLESHEIERVIDEYVNVAEGAV